MFAIAGITQIIQPLIDVFAAVLKFYHHLGVPWGWAIVLLTITIRACMIPLTIKQIGSMARMQQLQPEMKALQ
ncbi:MAG: YidC/Oxa1 family membrane protein insertase, partial [Solirubrobacteraceae bacterium]